MHRAPATAVPAMLVGSTAPGRTRRRRKPASGTSSTRATRPQWRRPGRASVSLRRFIGFRPGRCGSAYRSGQSRSWRTAAICCAGGDRDELAGDAAAAAAGAATGHGAAPAPLPGEPVGNSSGLVIAVVDVDRAGRPAGAVGVVDIFEISVLRRSGWRRPAPHCWRHTGRRR